MNRRNVLVAAALVALGLILTLTLRGSNQGTAPLSLGVEAVKTEAVATFAARLTETAATLAAAPTLTASPASSPTPAASATITATASATPTCYRLRWVKDLSIPDGTRLAPGASFEKTWLVENSGTCSWLKGFVFAFAGGDPMGGTNITLPQEVNAGARYTLSVPMTAPAAGGLLIGSWRMSFRGWFFGDTLTVKINVTPSSPAP